MISGRLTLILLLALGALGCKDEDRAEQVADSMPDLPDPLHLDCDRIVPPEAQATQFPGAGAPESTIVDDTAVCTFRIGAGRPASVSLFCARRKRNWTFDGELAGNPKNAPIVGLGRGAYADRDHVWFSPSHLDCLARVIWPRDPIKGAAVARALDPYLTKATVAR